MSCVPVKVDDYKESNFIINGILGGSAICNKLLTACFAFPQYMHLDNMGNAEAEIPLSVLRDMFGRKGKSIYGDIIRAIDEITNIQIVYGDGASYGVTVLVQRAEYNDDTRTMMVKFNSDLSSAVLDVQSNYTRLNLPTIIRLPNAIDQRLYEVFKSHAYQAGKNGQYQLDMSIAEIKIKSGMVRLPASTKTAKKLFKNQTPDYDALLKTAKDTAFEDYRHFARKLQGSIDHINALTDLTIKSEADRSGERGKINKITFTIALKRDKQADIFPVMVPYKEVAEEAEAVLGPEFDSKSVLAILSAAGGDIGKIKKAVKIYRKTQNVKSKTGFILSAIRNGYDVPQGKDANYGMEGVHKHDFDMLEEALLSN